MKGWSRVHRNFPQLEVETPRTHLEDLWSGLMLMGCEVWAGSIVTQLHEG